MHGKTKKHHHTHVGLNGRFDTLQAAVLLGKWPHFQEEVEKRNKIGARYSEMLNDHVTTPKVASGNTHVYAQYTIRVDKHKRDDLVTGMKESDIPVGIYYPRCFHEQPVFKYLGYKYGDFKESEKVSKQVLSLPMYPFLGNSQQEQITDTLKSLLK